MTSAIEKTLNRIGKTYALVIVYSLLVHCWEKVCVPSYMNPEP